MVHQSEPQSSVAEPSETVGDITLIPFPGIGDGVQDCGMEMSFQIRDKHFRHNNQPTEADMASLPTAAKGGMADTAKARPIHKRLDPTMPVRPLSSSIFVWLITAIMYTLWRYVYMSKAHRETALSPKPLDVALIRIGSVLCHYIHGINDIQESPGRIRMVILDCLNLLSLDICVQLRHPVDPERLGEDMRLFVVPFTMELHFLIFEVAYIFVGICLILASFYKVLWGLWDWVCPVVPGVAGAGGSDDEVDCGSPNIDMAAECSKRTAASAGHQTTKTESGGQESRDRDIVKVLKFSKSQNDRDLFSAFRKSYFAIRGWKLWFSFTHIHDIQYIKFNRYSSKQISRGDGLCYVDTTRQSLPDRQDRNYAIPHREPPVPIIRPMCRPEIMDHYDRPDYSINASDCIKFAMPKRVNDLPAGRCDTWGLYAAEAICPIKILIWALIVNIVPIFAFVPWWLVNHPGDLQNAFVPSTVISVAYFGTVSVHVAARMGKRYNYE
ncbi:hypothetical protein TWF706_006342 [Orbilia oligospora]|nr:hypothetical protein TWF706_006342 [Orbilia oligospora]